MHTRKVTEDSNGVTLPARSLLIASGAVRCKSRVWSLSEPAVTDVCHVRNLCICLLCSQTVTGYFSKTKACGTG